MEKSVENKVIDMNVEAEEVSGNKEMIERESIKDTPFEIISMDGYHFGVMGSYRLTEKENSKKTIKKDLERITWNRLIQVVMVLNQVKDKIEKKKENK